MTEESEPDEYGLAFLIFLCCGGILIMGVVWLFAAWVDSG